jgi:hypothetical protein
MTRPEFETHTSMLHCCWVCQHQRDKTMEPQRKVNSVECL